MLLAALLASVVGGALAARLHTDTDLSKLLPDEHPAVQALKALRDTVGTESHAAVLIESPSRDASKAFAEALIPRILELRPDARSEPYFRHVEYRRDPGFLERNALYFATTGELDELERFVQERIAAAKEEAHPLIVDLLDEEDEPADAQSAAGASESEAEAKLRKAYRDIVPSEYPFSDDGRILALLLAPTGAQLNLRFIEEAYGALGKLVAELNPRAFHPELNVELGGRLIRQLIEVRAITDDVRSSFASGVLAVLLLIIGYFFYKAYRVRTGGRFSWSVLASELVRTPLTGLIISIPLAMSLAWTFGVAYLAFGALNLMTSTLGLVLFGLGIDYGIHFYARYAEERAAGHGVGDAVEATFVEAGPAICMSGLTTALAFLTLTLADFRGFSEFGAISSIGMLFALTAMLLVLPALLVLAERLSVLSLNAPRASVELRRTTASRFPLARPVMLLSLLAVVLAVAYLPRIRFGYDFGKLEPEYGAYNRLKQKLNQVYPPGARNPAFILVDDPAEAPKVVEAVRDVAKQNPDSTVLKVESLEDRVPLAPEPAARRLRRIAEIRELLTSPFLKARRSEDLDRLRLAASTTEPIPLEKLPESLRERFTTKDGSIGGFVMIYPAVGLSDGRESMRFADEIGTIRTADGHEYHAASTSIVAANMLKVMIRESPAMILLTFASISLLMLVLFQSWRWALLSMLPLVVGMTWMLALMELFGIELNFYNLVVLPAVLGIGDDCGVHIIHRYREEGAGSIRRVLRTTGEPITMGALTTMVGFGGLVQSFHPGLESIGRLAILGIGTTLVSALVFLPALLQWLEDRGFLPQTAQQERPAA